MNNEWIQALETVENIANMQDTIINNLRDLASSIPAIPDLSKAAISAQAVVNSIEPMLNNVNFYTANIADSIDAILSSIQNKFDLQSLLSVTTAMPVSTENIDSFSEGIAESVNQIIQNLNWQSVIDNFEQNNASVSDIMEIASSTIDSNNSDDSNITKKDDDFTEDELYDCIEEQSSNPQGFQERFYNWTKKKQSKYYCFWLIIFIIFNIFVLPFLQDLGKPVMAKIASAVKLTPDKNAEVICTIEEGTEATIFENVKYYYKIDYIDSDGNEITGYVAKRNLKLENSNPVEDTSDEIEKTEYNQSVIKAMEEAQSISRDPDTKEYTNIDELKKALEE